MEGKDDKLRYLTSHLANLTLYSGIYPVIYELIFELCRPVISNNIEIEIRPMTTDSQPDYCEVLPITLKGRMCVSFFFFLV